MSDPHPFHERLRSELPMRTGQCKLLQLRLA